MKLKLKKYLRNVEIVPAGSMRLRKMVKIETRLDMSSKKPTFKLFYNLILKPPKLMALLKLKVEPKRLSLLKRKTWLKR